MTNQRHIIKRQILDLHIDDIEKAKTIQTEFGELYNQQLVRVLDELLSEFSTTKELVEIDSLEVDIGTFNWQELPKTINHQFKTQLRTALTKKLYKNRNGGQEKGVKIKELLLDSSSKNNHREQSGVLDYYFKNGLLPWWVSSSSIDIQQMVHKLSMQNPHFFQQKTKEWLSQESTCKRCIQYLSEETLLSLLKSLTSILWKAQPATFFEKMAIWWGNPFFQKKLIQHLSKETLTSFSLKKLSAINQFSQLEELLKANINFKNQTQRVALYELVIDNLWQSLKSKEKLVAALLSKETVNTKVVSSNTFDKMIVEGFAIPNAGIVLLWPFLQLFFKELGLLENRQFRNREAQWKAVHLLHYLETGTEDGEEFNWMVAKIIVGLAPNDFVPVNISLTDNEKEECDHLLQSAINNWSVLKKSSINSLRKTFLQREGILYKDSNGWLIKISDHVLDILLKKLTWPISVIKLPWNGYMIHVEWA